MTFSVITCTYNAEAVLQRTLNSVQQQTHPNVQHIIVDGASTDTTIEIAKKYQTAQPDKVLLISEPDKGLYDAMNKGLALATGDYVVFLNAGDTFHSVTTLTDITAQLEVEVSQRGVLPGVAYGRTNIVDAKGHFLRERHLQPPKRLTWKSFKNGMLVCHQAFYARTDIAKSVKYDLQYRFSADVDWCIRVMQAAEQQGLRLYNTGLTLCDYLDGGLSVKNHRVSLWERFNIMRKHYGLVVTVFQHFKFIWRNS